MISRNVIRGFSSASNAARQTASLIAGVEEKQSTLPNGLTVASVDLQVRYFHDLILNDLA